MVPVTYEEDVMPFSSEIVALVDDASIYTYNLSLLSQFSLVAYMARNV
jgi:hypothetical protein